MTALEKYSPKRKLVGHGRKLPEQRFPFNGELDICSDFRNVRFVEPGQITPPQAATRARLDAIRVAKMIPSI